MTQEVLELIEHYDEYDDLTVERVQDLVEIALLGSKHKATAKAYILYREKRNQAGSRHFQISFEFKAV